VPQRANAQKLEDLVEFSVQPTDITRRFPNMLLTRPPVFAAKVFLTYKHVNPLLALSLSLAATVTVNQWYPLRLAGLLDSVTLAATYVTLELRVRCKCHCRDLTGSRVNRMSSKIGADASTCNLYGRHSFLRGDPGSYDP
jgi:hypothetical protein